MSQEGGEPKKKESVSIPKEGSDAGQPVQSLAKASKNDPKPNSPASPPKQPLKESVTAKSAMPLPGQMTAGTKTEKPNESPEKNVQSETTNEKAAVPTGKKIQMDGKRVENVKNALADADWGWRIKSKGGTKYETRKVSGSKSEAASKSTQADLDYGPYSRRYRDSWNPEYEWGYYGAYGEWRPEEEWPYYAPYGMEPSAPYYPFPSEPPCRSRRRPPFPSPSCPIHGYMRQRPAPQRSQGTIISIPIPISIPMPMPSGSSSGPVVINPPPPLPPPQLPPPAQPERRTTPLQDMTSFMMAMMLKDSMKRSTGDLFPSQDSQAQRGQPVTATSDYDGHRAPSEPADNQLSFMHQQSPLSPEPSKYTGAIAEGEPVMQGIIQEIATNHGKKKEKKKHNAEKDDKKPAESAENKATKEERARQHKAVSKQGADEVISLGSSDSSLGNKSPT
ncbi:serine/arginine repetitive matrix protein 1, partial [Dermacentor silvarum]|uniref:serine/arginine repetitive matrix protein 1 n=1 Tax=Dermacentor silvarum TaxID=543639 RepID=UPI00189906EA